MSAGQRDARLELQVYWMGTNWSLQVNKRRYGRTPSVGYGVTR